jgi:hypothetical protein
LILLANSLATQSPITRRERASLYNVCPGVVSSQH